MTGKWLIIAHICLVVVATAATMVADDTLQAKIDSMFVIASSGDFKFRELVEPTIEDMAALGEVAVPYLIDRLGTKDSRERFTLRTILEKIGSPAVPYLNEALLKSDSLKLSRIALVLYYIPDSSSVDNLMAVSDNEYYWVRYQAVRALGKIGDMRAASAVERAFQDNNELIRTMAAVAAGRLGAREFIKNLAMALADSYYGVRMAAFEELKNLDCNSKRDSLLPFLEGREDGLARTLLLAVMTESPCAYDLKSFQSFLDHDDPIMQALALKSIHQLAPDSAQHYLVNIYRPVENLYLRQVIEQISSSYEKKASANP